MSPQRCPNCGSEIVMDSLLPEDEGVCPICRTKVADAPAEVPLFGTNELLQAVRAKPAKTSANEADLHLADVSSPQSQPAHASVPIPTPSSFPSSAPDDDYRLAPPVVPERPVASSPRPFRSSAEPRRSHRETQFFRPAYLVVLAVTALAMMCLFPLGMFFDPPKGFIILWGMILIFVSLFWVGWKYMKITGEDLPPDEAPWYLRGGWSAMWPIMTAVYEYPIELGPPFSLTVLGGMLILATAVIPDGWRFLPFGLGRPAGQRPAPVAGVQPQPQPQPLPAQPPPKEESPPPPRFVPDTFGPAPFPPALNPARMPPVKELFTSGNAIYLSDLQEFDLQSGMLPIGKDGNLGNGPRITVKGKQYPKGLGMHPPGAPSIACARYRPGKQPAILEGAVALNDTAEKPWSAALFEIYGDGELLWKSPPIRSKGQMSTFRVDVGAVEVIELRVATEGPASGVHAVWLDPRLVKP